MTRPRPRPAPACALLVLLLAAAFPAAAAKPAAPVEKLDALLARAIPGDGPGVAVIAVKDGKTVFRKARGMANLELGVPLSPDSVFRLGSITK